MEVAVSHLGITIISVAIIVGVIGRVLNWVWLRPKRLEKRLREEGFKGNSYRLLFGDERELRSMMQDVKTRPINLEDDPVPRVLPYQDKTVKRYGKNCFIWIGPTPLVILMNPEHIKEVFNNMVDFPKVKSNPLIKYLLSGIADHEGEKWVKHRKIINPAFHLEKLKLMLPAFCHCANEMVNKWIKLTAEKGSCEVDVWPYLNSSTGDVISRTAFGSSFEAGTRIFQLLLEQSELTARVMRSLYFPGWRFVPTKTHRRMRAIENEVQELLKGVIQLRESARKEGEAPKNDLLGLLLESNRREMQQGEKGMSVKDIIDECKIFYFAGQETTAVMLNWTMVLLSRFPEWQTRARDEIRELFGNRKPTYDELSRVKVVTMILYESLRLYPPAPWLNRAMPKDTKLGNFTLPANSVVWIPVLLVQHDTEIWGHDAKEFNPERFSEGVLKATKGKSSFLPFGVGPRICIGQNYALLEAKMLMVLVLQNFWFELSPNYVHAPYLSLNIAPQYGTPIILHKF
ncbi:hypothetical protein L6164_022744 [Bauhinia variegata]|uniref:Uncharacterized protein n=1 Tax=Bauhinia variegata TaxID=167791 RepID=A0ACB9MG62_BAUVA|nr:hypothetical protein L6164_022744 [Bauhinia variegata]